MFQLSKLDDVNGLGVTVFGDLVPEIGCKCDSFILLLTLQGIFC